MRIACPGPSGCSGYQVCTDGGTSFGACICDVAEDGSPTTSGDGTATPDGTAAITPEGSGAGDAGTAGELAEAGDAEGADATSLDSTIDASGSTADAVDDVPDADATTDQASADETTQDGPSQGDAASPDATDASSLAAPDGGLADGSVVGTLCSTCPAGTKVTPTGACVPIDDPFYGCSDPSTPRCHVAHAYQTCDAQNHCAAAACRSGWADCNHDPSDGCEADLTAAATCGSCTNSCPSGQVCYHGACTSTACLPPLTNCNGSCVDLTTSAANCQGCGYACPSYGSADAVCNNGVCTYSCDPGKTFSYQIGDCTDRSRDPNCCGTGCSATAATGVCSAAKPGIPVCVSGVCDFTCPFGWTRCAGSCVQTSTDPANCGGCGSACPNAQVCQAGHCTSEATLLVTTANNPGDLAIDGTSIYYTNLGDDSIRKVDLSGGAVTTLAINQYRPERIAVDGTYVYWSSNLGSGVFRTLEDGQGTPAAVAVAAGPWGVAADSSYLYWSDTTTTGTPSIWRGAMDGGGTPTALLSHVGLYPGQRIEISVGFGHLTIGASNGVSSWPFSADGGVGTGINVYASSTANLGGMDRVGASCSDGTAIGWRDWTTGQGWTTSGYASFRGTATQASGFATGACGAAYASSGQGIYMLQHAQAGIWGLAFPVVSLSSSTPNRLAVGGGYIAWTYAGTSSPTSHDGGIYKIALPQ
jgi:hypothetical protein